MERFLGQACLHEETGGTHAAALARNGKILVVREDIGRHNTIDMLGGYALLHGVDCRDAVILRTGRVSSEIVHKIRRLGVPLVCSLSVPTRPWGNGAGGGDDPDRFRPAGPNENLLLKEGRVRM